MHSAFPTQRVVTILAVLLVCPKTVGATSLGTRLRRAHTAQVRARTLEQYRRAVRRVERQYSHLERMLHRPGAARRVASDLLVELVRQSGTPGVNGSPRLYPRRTGRNHDLYDDACASNLRRLMRLALRLTRSHRAVARRMVARARSEDYAALVTRMHAARRLNMAEEVRWSALQALLHFEPAEQLVFDPNARPSGLSRHRINELTQVLRAVRGIRAGWHAFGDLRRADTATYGRSAAPRLQAIAYLARRRRGGAAARLRRELHRWEGAAHQTLLAHAGDRWVPARGDAHRTAMGLGHLWPAPVQLARRR